MYIGIKAVELQQIPVRANNLLCKTYFILHYKSNDNFFFTNVSCIAAFYAQQTICFDLIWSVFPRIGYLTFYLACYVLDFVVVIYQVTDFYIVFFW